jgi:hypothetical protein
MLGEKYKVGGVVQHVYSAELMYENPFVSPSHEYK